MTGHDFQTTWGTHLPALDTAFSVAARANVRALDRLATLIQRGLQGKWSPDDFRLAVHSGLRVRSVRWHEATSAALVSCSNEGAARKHAAAAILSLWLDGMQFETPPRPTAPLADLVAAVEAFGHDNALDGRLLLRVLADTLTEEQASEVAGSLRLYCAGHILEARDGLL